MLSVRLMHRDRKVDFDQPPPPNSKLLVQDLELPTLFAAMGDGDPFLTDVARHTVITSLTDLTAIEYRRAIVEDSLDNAAIVREMYDVVATAIDVESKIFHSRLAKAPDAVLNEARRSLRCFAGPMRRLRQIGDEHGAAFASPGFRTFFDMLESELDDAYLNTIDDHLRGLNFRHGPLISVQLGRGNRGTGFRLHKSGNLPWVRWPPIGSRRTFSFEIGEHDLTGSEELGRLRSRGVDRAANAVARAAAHVLRFFTTLRSELAFYVGCINLHDRLVAKGEPTCFPVPTSGDDGPVLRAAGLYDIGLTMSIDERAVGNDIDADGRNAIVITGANQGGKSTFLRGLGTAQLMMQCGMFAPARSLSADVRSGVFTHFRREEDEEMASGKLDEELARMDDIVRSVETDGMVLCNESFSSTNEREGSEIARHVVRAFMAAGVKIVFVTHLFDFADGMRRSDGESVLFLRASRGLEGRRTYRLVEGPPLPTSFGEDVYRQVFADG